MADPSPLAQAVAEQNARRGIMGTQGLDPARAARSNELAKRYGFDPEVVDADFQGMDEHDRMQRALREASRSPSYGAMMANPRFAAAAINDKALPKVASAVDRHRKGTLWELKGYSTLNGVKLLAAGATNLVGGFLGDLGGGISKAAAGGAEVVMSAAARLPAPLRRQLADNPGFKSLLLTSATARKAAEGFDWVSDKTTVRTGNRNADDVMMGIRSAGSSLAALGVTVATRSPAAGAGIMATATGGNSYDEARQQGVDPFASAAYGSIDAAIEFATEYVGQRLFGNAIRSGKGFLPSLGFNVAAEVPGEQAATVLQELNKWYFLERPQGKTLGEYAAELPDEMRSTFVATVAAVGLTGSIGYPVGKAVDRHVARVAGSNIDAIMEAAAGSEARGANPSDFETVLNQQLEGRPGENLYIPGEQVASLFAETDMREDPFWSQYADQVEEAQALGGDVVIPLAAAATHLAGSPQWQALREHVRATPGGMSIAEAKVKQTPEELQQLAEQLSAQIEERLPQLAASRVVKQLATDMGYEGEQADAITRLVSARLSVATGLENRKRAARGEAPTTAEQVFKDWNLSAANMQQSEFDAGGTRGEIYDRSVREPLNQIDEEDIRGIVQLANQPGHNRQVLAFGGAQSWLVEEAGLYGLDIAGTSHTLDTSGIRHVLRNHSDAAKEAKRGNVAVTEQDLAAIPTILSDPDHVAFGLKSKQGHDTIVYAKSMPDGSTIYIEEVFSARKRLMLKTMWKVSGTIDASRLRATLNLNARSASQTGLKIIDRPARRKGQDGDPALAQQKRGNISIARDENGRMTGALIRAFESANFSTAVHELGHFWLEDLRSRAIAADALPEEQADWQVVQAWFQENEAETSSTIPVEAHEMWARGMERYIFEGTAPSPGLRSLFAKMRDWMMSIYQTVSAFNSPITPQIRQVMDRMFATDEEIGAQRAEMALVSQRINDLLTEAEETEYRRLADEGRNEARDKLLSRILIRLRGQRSREAADRRRQIRADAEEQIDGLPVFRALKVLRVGLERDGERVRTRLSREWLTDTYGEEMLNQLPKWIQPIYDTKDTIDADALAEIVGFTSGDQMVRALQALEVERQDLKRSGDSRSPRARMVDELVDDRENEELGDPYENIEEEAQAALAGDQQADLMSLEMRALSRKTGQAPTPWKMAKEWAAAHVLKQRNRDALSGSALQMYTRNAGKAGRNAEEALIKGDFEAAFRAKQQQMLNLALLSEAKKAKDRTDKSVRRLRKLAAKDTIKSIDQDYLDQVHQLLEDVDLKTRSGAAEEKRKSFEAWYGEQVARGAEPVVPAEYQRLLGKVNWQDLTVGDLVELDEVVSQIVQLGRLKQRLRDGQEERDFDEAVADGVATTERLRRLPKSNLMDEGRSTWLRAKSIARGFDAALMKIEVICDWLDGNDPNGPFNRLIFHKMADAQAAKHRMTAEYAAKMDALIASLPRKTVRDWDRKVDTPELINRGTGAPWELGKDQIIAIALNMGNEQNIQRLVDGYGWDETNVRAVLNRLMSAEDWAFVQGAWDIIDQLWPDISAMERRVNGVAPPKVEAQELVTDHGTFRGGYYPAVYDTAKSEAAAVNEAKDMFSPIYQRATTRASSTQKRVDQVERPLLLSLGVITRHMEEVIHDITHREAVMEVDKFTSDKRIKQAVSETLGPEYAKLFRPWLQSIANEMTTSSAAQKGVDGFFRQLRTRTTMVGLALRPMSALLQTIGISNVVGEVGAARFAQGFAQFAMNPAAAYRKVTSLSGEMASRFQNVDRDVRENLQRHGKRSGLEKVIEALGIRAVQRHAYDLIMIMDLFVTTPGWLGAYAKGQADGMDEEASARYADKVIRLSQGAGGAKDQAAIMNMGEVVRVFTMFYSYFSALYGRQRDIGRRLANVRSGKDAFEVSRRMLWIMLLPPLFDALMRGEGAGDDDEDGEVSAEERGRWLLRKVTFGSFASIPLIRDFIGYFDKGYGYKITPISNVGEGITKTYEDLTAGLDEDDDASDVWLKRTFTTIGLLFKLPTGYAGQEAQYALDVQEGDQPAPEDLGDWWSAATKGKVEAE